MKTFLVGVCFLLAQFASPFTGFSQEKNSLFHYKDKIILKTNQVLFGQLVFYDQDSLIIELKSGNNVKFLSEQIKSVVQYSTKYKSKLPKLSVMKNPDKSHIFALSTSVGLGSFRSDYGFGQEISAVYKYNTHKKHVLMGGVGLDAYSVEESLAYFPIMTGYEYHFPVKMENSLYCSLLTGYSLPFNPLYSGVMVLEGGWMLNPGIGILFASGGRMGFFMEVGAKFQQASYSTWRSEEVINSVLQRFIMRFGMIF